MYFIHDFFVCFVLFCFIEVSSFGEAQGLKLYLDWVFFFNVIIQFCEHLSKPDTIVRINSCLVCGVAMAPLTI